MSYRRLLSRLALLLSPFALLAAGLSTAHAQGCASGACGQTSMASCAPCTSDVQCQKFHCPAPFIHCTPEPPKIKYKCACPKPICNPCDLDPTGNYGYTPTCWRPWMAQPNYDHCPVPSPTQLAPNGVIQAVPMPLPAPLEQTLPPAPRLESRLRPVAQ